MQDFSLLITKWYRQNQRDLPWRRTKNPYHVWLSEIILQQTRVDQGTDYYLKFIKHYPTVHDLARAEEMDVLNDWQGLGYYSRARNLHFSAKFISNELEGTFPSTYKDILKLKGVGKYTAAAIASFAFDEKKAVVDGNVYRVLSRVFDIETPIDSTQGQKEFQEIADSLIRDENPAEHNQAIMELGAMVCSPKPKCAPCPVIGKCLAFKNKTIEQRPIKAKKTKVRDRYFHFLIFEKNGKTLLEQRTEKDVWQNMYQFPLIESKELALPDGYPEIDSTSEEVKHILSHQRIHARFHHFSEFPEERNDKWITLNRADIQDYPLPRIIDRYLEEQG